LKPASKPLGLQGVFIRGKGLKYVITDSAFKRVQVDARACWLDTGEHHRGLALRTSGALNCNEWNDALRLGHDASLKEAGAQHSLSPVMPRRRSGDCRSMRLQRHQTRVNSRICARKVGTSRYSGAADSRRWVQSAVVLFDVAKPTSLFKRYSERLDRGNELIVDA
jgi:hypothetical protein